MEPYLYLPFETRDEHGSAELRCTVYHRNNALQSIRLRVEVTPNKTRKVAQTAEVDYALSPALADLDGFAERELNVLTNESVRGTHTIVVKGAEGAVEVSLTESGAKAVLKAFRTELEMITVGSNGSPLVPITPSPLLTSFMTCASSLISVLSFGERSCRASTTPLFLRAKLKTRSTIQISRVTSVVFPWALVYDLPHTINGSWTPCPLLTHWDAERSKLSDYPVQCPHASNTRRAHLCLTASGASGT